MPVTLIDRLPLPNLKVYTAASVSLLSVAVYYALSVTGEAGWRANATLARAGAAGEAALQPAAAERPPASDLNSSRIVFEQVADVLAFMMQEPLCMWTVINMSYCLLALLGWGVQRLVFGRLRVAEAARVRDKFWNYVFYKFIFVFGVLNVQFVDEVLMWSSWFTAVGFLHLLGQLCKDRFEYLSSSPNSARWAHVRLAALLTAVAVSALGLLAAAAIWALPVAKDTFAFMAAECILVLVGAVHVMSRYVLRLLDCDASGPPAYYTHLAFDSAALIVEAAHVLHMVLWSNVLLSMASLVLLLQLRHLLQQLQARLRRHRRYTRLQAHMTTSYPMASKEEVEKNQDNCAICWEPMKEARKLPCDHLFHNSCLCQWMQQDASCPTCRRALAARPPPAAPAPPAPAPPAPVNHLFQFHGSRYVSWLPSFSVEVTRVRREPLPPAQLDALARQVQAMFPHYALAPLLADLAATRSADLTVDNILEGRLPPPAPPPRPLPRPPHRHRSHLCPRPYLTRRYSTRRPNSEEITTEFPQESSERESNLQRRKRLLLARARRRYLARPAAAPAPARDS
ncbi:E3 ubiquitin-protein ligase AMFR-like [Leguminivora glycinivorella]|uniref:E3 ubiquitin-protein ligase AMFR-like n=1 Tax=Leguminivora glycinivorella TaxID=1035111 RepID=UPI00200D0AF3|nr:E3 ubiquitin-protein ligase AMFR-like [Leguminivora glycinivorella]